MGCVNSLTNYHKVMEINLHALCNSSHTTQVKQGEKSALVGLCVGAFWGKLY